MSDPEAHLARAGAALTILCDPFPRLSETFVREEARALRALGYEVSLEAGKRPPPWNRGSADDLPVRHIADDSGLERARSLAWLVASHPLACARDLVARRRWRHEERVRPLRKLAPMARRIVARGDRHMHAHFAKTAALDALRIARLTGLPFSVTAHAYDIYKEPANLREKLRAAAFATGVSDHAVRDLRAAAGERPAARIDRIAMGVDVERFRRTRSHGEGRVVVAIGRLVEKKGFTHLLDAAALLRDSAPLERLVILGEGELGEVLRAQSERLGLADAVEWIGRGSHEEVRDLLERADLLVMPCVVAADGDRDGIPVVIYEALAMEVPVVASDEIGLAEVVHPDWGHLAPPGDSEALARAIDELLSLPAERRAEMGHAGRAFVSAERSVGGEAARLAGMIETTAGGSAGARAPRRVRVPPAVRRLASPARRRVRSLRARRRRRSRRGRSRRRRLRRRARRAVRRPKVALRLGRLVRERGRFTARELLGGGEPVRRYRLRDAEAQICLRHGRMSGTLRDVFQELEYDPLPEVRRLLSGREPRIVDLGGFVGYAGVYFLSTFPSARVVAYEADPASARIHRAAIERNRFGERWRLVEAAASSAPGEVEFLARGTPGSRVALEEDGPRVTVERHDVLPELQRADLAKIDIEGGEWPILADERFGSDGPRVVVLEYHEHGCPGGEPRAEAIRLLKRAGYRILDHPYPPRKVRERQGLLWAVKRR